MKNLINNDQLDLSRSPSNTNNRSPVKEIYVLDDDSIEDVSPMTNNNKITKDKIIINEAKSRRLPKKIKKTLGYEYDHDINTDKEFCEKIIKTNTYLPSKQKLFDYYSEIYQLLELSEFKDNRNIGTIIGMAILGLIGFFAFSFTIIGGIAGGIIGIGLGRYAGKKIVRRVKRKGAMSNEELFLTKLRCLIEWGETHSHDYKFNINEYRFIFEKIIEEFSAAIYIELFENQKELRNILFKLRKFLLKDFNNQTMRLSYQLFKIYFKTIDINDPIIQVEAANQIYFLFTTYKQIFDIKFPHDDKNKRKKLEFPLMYHKITKLLESNAIKNLVKNYPNVTRNPQRLEQFKQLLKEDVDINKKIIVYVIENKELLLNTSLQNKVPILMKDSLLDKIKINKTHDKIDYHPDQIIETDDCIKRKPVYETGRTQSLNIRELSLTKCRSPKKILPDIDYNNERIPKIISSNFISEKAGSVKTSARNESLYKYPILDSKPISVLKGESMNNEINGSVLSIRSQNKKAISLENSQRIEGDILIEVNGSAKVPRLKFNFEEVCDMENSQSQHKRYCESSNKPVATPKLADYNKNTSRFKKFDDHILYSSPKKLDKEKSLHEIELHNSKGVDLVKMPSDPSIQCIEKIKTPQKSFDDMGGSISNKNIDDVSPKQVLPVQSFEKITNNEVIFKRILSIDNENFGKWEKVLDNPIIKIQKIRPEDNPVVLIRAVATLEGFSPKEIYDVIYDSAYRAKWDSVVNNFRVVEKIDEFTDIIYFVIKAPFGVSNRDFLQTRCYRLDYPQKDHIIISFQSTIHPSVPLVKGHIRGDTINSGYIIRPHANYPKKCTELVIVSQVDIKGSIPKTIVNYVASKAPLEWVNKLMKAAKERLLNKA